MFRDGPFLTDTETPYTPEISVSEAQCRTLNKQRLTYLFVYPLETCTVAVCPNLLLSFLLPADPVLIQCNSIQTCTVPLLWLTPARRSEAELHSEKTSTVAGFHVYWDGWMHVSVIASAHSFCNGDIWQLRVLRLMLPVTVACGGIERYLW